MIPVSHLSAVSPASVVSTLRARRESISPPCPSVPPRAESSRRKHALRRQVIHRILTNAHLDRKSVV